MELKKLLILGAMAGVLFVSCESESTEEVVIDDPIVAVQSRSRLALPDLVMKNSVKGKIYDNLGKHAVEPSECGDTEFNRVIRAEVDRAVTDPNFINNFRLLTGLTQISALIHNDNQRFGTRNEHFDLVNKTANRLNKFWGLQDFNIQMRGQGKSILRRKGRIIDALVFGFTDADGNPLSEEQAAGFADIIVDILSPASDFIPESPLLFSDGFTLRGDIGTGRGVESIVVIGDGLVSFMDEAGVPERTAWKGIMAHEYAHQVQFKYGFIDQLDAMFDNEPERTRASELEADFFTGYYMTNRKGGELNWRVAQNFLEAFFLIGDCGFDADGHHGTPLQRMQAAYEGYLLGVKNAENGRQKSPKGAHRAFLKRFDRILAGFQG